MLFNSIEFALFFPLVFVLYWGFFQKHTQSRNLFLLVVSYTFYGWWDWRFLALIIISSVVDFFIGQQLAIESREKRRRVLLAVSLFVNLGFLGVFKYYNFFVESFVYAFTLFGINISTSTINIILPVGISFYTFQTLSYTLDIYFRKFTPTKDFLAFLAFVAFFPQLVAGPIERAKKLLPQFLEKRKVSYEMLRSGLILMAWGFLKKIVIADRLGIFIDNAYSDVGALDGISILVATVFFAFQLYLDFSAYSDIAIGSGRMLGFNLSTNFARPYLASTFSDFWKRWHISLSSWFKDYVFIPLGGSSKGHSNYIKNIFIVFFLSGLWHGASWNFVFWGGINGLFILFFDNFLKKIKLHSLKRFFSSLLIFLMWAISLVFFRSQTLTEAITLISNIGLESKDMLYKLGLNETEFSFTLFLLIALMIIEFLQERYATLYEKFISLPFIVRWASYLLMVFFIIFFGSYGINLSDNSFIYFQF